MKYVFLLLVICSLQVSGQDKTIQGLKSESSRTISKNAADTSKRKWKTGGTFNLNVNQGALSNWAAGVTNSLCH
ncbi:hypothetical protein [Paraflavitalea speifideaquila]|uniref:hypothetical protein n=1 Tax=Paraflavitalea speifideaquila TaxID=3076558 RepID=UPI0028EC7B0F|nr:hypothetical protein [Paraflavitalea speifideiaquila]